MNPRRDLKQSLGECLEDSRDEIGTNLELSLDPVDGHMLNQRRFMSEHTTCAMCDTKLEIRHEINTNDLKVREEAHCPSCGIRVRSTHHLMH